MFLKTFTSSEWCTSTRFGRTSTPQSNTTPSSIPPTIITTLFPLFRHPWWGGWYYCIVIIVRHCFFVWWCQLHTQIIHPPQYNQIFCYTTTRPLKYCLIYILSAVQTKSSQSNAYLLIQYSLYRAEQRFFCVNNVRWCRVSTNIQHMNKLHIQILSNPLTP